MEKFHLTYVGTAIDDGSEDVPNNCESSSSSSLSLPSASAEVCCNGHSPDINDMSPPIVVVSTVVFPWPSLKLNENMKEKMYIFVLCLVVLKHTLILKRNMLTFHHLVQLLLLLLSLLLVQFEVLLVVVLQALLM